MTVTLHVNGERHSSPAEPDTPLLYVLRNDLGLNSMKYGCGSGHCGSCTVLIDGQPMRSCSVPASAAAQRRIVTLEALGTPEQPHPLQRAFIEEQAAQCGYCSAGMILTAKALLDRTPAPSEDQIRSAMADNLCRCGTHTRILKAIRRAAADKSL
ncbi:(2Fe-2S)-binding protein [Ramlibacter monticola]|uniref:(2Fe-2S)-binding protein n=1 Tax=Ramlibacter monticola TaxID=1926872 RepID=A0A936Z1E7_9BURK|nr:(2Fe-2S)-binding protein [Ramlibacter monticola]MBL0392878.1 (2Fe-2S)-binding protein [Ramlibacter monticola]